MADDPKPSDDDGKNDAGKEPPADSKPPTQYPPLDRQPGYFERSNDPLRRKDLDEDD